MMMKMNFLVLCLLFSSFLKMAYGQQFFSDKEKLTFSESLDLNYMPKKYRLVHIDQNALIPYLKTIPLHPQDEFIMELPDPERGIQKFRIWKTPIMEPGLQKKYAHLETFTGVHVENPLITTKMDFTENGFHAMVYNGEETYFIDPIRAVFSDAYMVYFKKDYNREINSGFSCELNTDQEIAPGHSIFQDLSFSGSPSLASLSFGTEKNIYRIAISTTGEYSRAVAGNNPTKAQVLSSIITTLNRVSGVYERELSISFQLVNNNDDIIFLDPDTDPFSNNNATMQLRQNREVLNQQIGLDHYDIGHVFSTGAGGLATLGVICTNRKAQGATGSQSPYSDRFDIDYVAHEIGHQMGANHTMSQCYNEHRLAAYEPGSGSTIMGYAGICGQNNIQNYSDDYFHAISLLEIRQTVLRRGTCAITSPGVGIPESLSIQASYNIPYKTPFELTADTTSVLGDSDTLLYVWEQFDNAILVQSERDNLNRVNGPTFRSYIPGLSPTRVFPRMESVIRGNLNNLGERVPQVARKMTFVLTVRNIYNGWGAFQFVPEISNDSLQGFVDVDFIDTGEPFEVTSPNTSIVWKTNTTETITWNIAQTDINPIDCQFVTISLSEDGGYTYPYILAENVPNTGSTTITVPNLITNRARVKIKAVDNIFFDISDNNFTIADELSIQESFAQYISVYPNPAKSDLIIENSSDLALDIVLLNNLGQEIKRTKQQTKKLHWDITHLIPGMYFIFLKNPKTGIKYTEKIFINP